MSAAPDPLHGPRGPDPLHGPRGPDPRHGPRGPDPEVAIALLAHGSPDPAWLWPIEQIAARMRAGRPGVRVGVATLEHGTSLAEVVAALATAGARRVAVVPVFLSGGGRHLTRDVPELVARVRRDRPDLEIALAGDALGADPAVLDAFATAALRRAGLDSPP